MALPPSRRRFAPPRTWGLPVVLLLLILLAACGGDAQAEPTATATATPEAATTVPATPTTAPTPTPTPTAFAAILDGVEMPTTDYQQRLSQPPVAVMVDNHPAAYPHSGLDRADIVIEAFVEGHITRYMAVYWRRDADFIEPVRSARTPFVIWAHELNALMAFVGTSTYPGEADASERIREYEVPFLDHDEALGPPTFYRDQQRFAPHNVVTATDALRATAADMGRLESDAASTLAPWPFKAPGAGTTSEPDATHLEVRFSPGVSRGVVVQWEWDPSTGSYARFRAGEPHLDAQTAEQLTATNVITMVVPTRVVSEHGHLVYDQVGEGAATVYLDGKRIDATWRKPSVDARTRFFDADGDEVAFNPGPTWIAMLSPASTVTESVE